MTNHYYGRSAFLLNANARSVTKAQRQKLLKLIPKEHFYCSTSISEAKNFISEILEKGYANVFCGGGDGTVVSAINLINDLGKNVPEHELPRIGVLRLGTGNALASVLEAGRPLDDIKTILGGKNLEPVLLDMIENREGRMTPFAGIGYDGELMNDFEAIKDVFFDSPLRKTFTSLFGFTFAGVFKTLPRQINKKPPHVVIKSTKPAYRIKKVRGKDEEIFLEAGSVLYDDRAPLICVGTVKYVGLNFTMFPFASKRPGYMHLRISAVPISVCLANLYPAIWNGTFRHPKLFDFLVKDVTIESDESLPYQFGGDAMGYKKKLEFSVSKDPVKMVRIKKPKKKVKIGSDPVMTPLIL